MTPTKLSKPSFIISLRCPHFNSFCSHSSSSSSANLRLRRPRSFTAPSPFQSSNCLRLVVVSAASSSAPASRRCELQRPLILDKSALVVEEAVSEEELWATACFRIRCFYDNQDSSDMKDDKILVAERVFEALRQRIAGQTKGILKSTCINASLPLSVVPRCSDDLWHKCKFSVDGEDRVVVGTLDVNNCLRLLGEMTGTRPEGIGADFARAYISNLFVAKELHRNGLGYELILKARAVAEEWGITDLYVHVAVDNEPAKGLYMKSGFIHESDEPAWQARYLNRTQRSLLWMGFPDPYNL